MKCLSFLGINAQNGFSSYSFKGTFGVNSKIYDCKTVYCDEKYILYQINDDIYFFMDYMNVYQIIFYKNLVKECVKKIVDDLFYSGISYKIYDKDYGRYIQLKDVYNENKLSVKVNNIIDNIVSKIQKHKGLTINIVLHGMPGTGKSSCIETMANKLDGNIYVLPIDTNLKNAVIQLGEVTKSIILIPELDKFLLNKNDDFAEREQLLLEFLSGCYTTKNNIVTITCNDIKIIREHPIMTRPGRVHFMIEFGTIDKAIIRDAVLEYYPDFKNFDIFNKFIGKVTIAEFKTAIINCYVMDKPIDESFSVERIEYNRSMNGLYL